VNELDPDSIEAFVAQLADGRRIDWEHAKAVLPEEYVERLIRVDQLMQTIRSGPEGTDAEFEKLTNWGHLQVHESLGQGQFGEVFRAFDPILQRDVALKLSRSQSIQADPRSWIAEARRLARVRHPNVLAVHGADIHDGVPGLWADRVRGQSLAEYLQEHPFSRPERLRIQLRLAEAVRAVHNEGLAHGDIKPANVLVDHDDRPILMDFGAARELHDDSDSKRSIGTPLFMAPERLAGAPASSAADVFALGAVLVFMATGTAPFVAETLDELMELHRKNDSGWSRHPSITGADRRLLLDMLNPDPDRRPSADEVVHQLERIQSAPARRRRAGAVATIILLLSGGLATALIGFFNVRSAEQETAAMNELLRDVLAAPRANELGRNTRVVDVLDLALFESGRRFDDQPEIQARVQALVGSTYENLGLDDQAQPLLDQAYAFYLDQLGEDHPEVIALLDPMARAYRGQGKLDEAEALWNRALALSDPTTSEGRNEQMLAHVGLANLAMQRNALDLALTELDQALALHLDEGTAHSALLARMLKGLVLFRSGSMAEAEVLAVEALDESLRLNGPRHINTLVARNRLIEIRIGLNQSESTEPMARENLALAMDWLGADDGLTVTTQITLSNLLAELGKTDESLALLDDAVIGAERAFPSDAPNTLMLAVNRAARNLELGRPERTVELAMPLQQQLETSSIPVGQLLWINGLNLVEALVQTGRFEEARLRATNQRAELSTSFGPAHPLSAIAASYEAAALNRLGQLEAAEELLETSVEQLTASIGAQNPQTLLAQGWQALNLHDLGRRDLAGEQMASVLQSARSSLGDDHYRVRDLEALAALMTASASE
jgi:tetratricopeptide (TPR) repeat protein